MAIVYLRETFADERAERDASREILIRTFIVLTDDVNSRREAILNAEDPDGNRIPQMGDTYPFATRPIPNVAAHVIDMQAFRLPKSNTAWTVYVTYSTETTAGGVTDPTFRAPQVRFFSENFIKVVDREVRHENNRAPGDNRTAAQDHRTEYTNGDVSLPVLNTAGDPFEPLPEVDDAYPGVEIIRNELAFGGDRSSFAFERFVQMNNTINIDPFTLLDFPIGQYQSLLRIDAELLRESGVSFLRVSYKILINRKTWILGILNNGFKYKPFGAGEGFLDRIDFRGDDGEKGKTLGLLGWDGNQLNRPNANPPTNNEPIYLPFHVYDEEIHGSLQLPQSMSQVLLYPYGG